jgi:membrane-associated protease RseP (regulator of RpoE activity)
VVGADGVTFESFEEMRLFVEAHPSETVTFDAQRNGEVQQIEGTIGENPDTGLGLLGVRTDPDELPRINMGPIEAVPESVQLFGEITKETVVSIGGIFSPSGLVDFFGRLGDTGDDAATVAGAQPGEVAPATEADDNEGRILSLVGATRLGAELTSGGMAGVLIFFLSVNIFVGVINLAPLLPLDGGHVVIATYERIRSRNGKRYYADAAKALPVAYAVILLMTTVGIAALYLDIADPISL